MGTCIGSLVEMGKTHCERDARACNLIEDIEQVQEDIEALKTSFAKLTTDQETLASTVENGAELSTNISKNSQKLLELTKEVAFIGKEPENPQRY